MNISLIGMPGAGKSTIGKLLAEKLIGFDYIDIDEIIVKLEKTSINRIFERFGEEYFRNLETKVLNDLLDCPRKFRDKESERNFGVATLKSEHLYGDDESAAKCDTGLDSSNLIIFYGRRYCSSR